MITRTVTLPINPASSAWSYLTWGTKDPLDTMPYHVDATAFLGDDSLNLTSPPDISVTSDLFISPAIVSGGIISMAISGGAPGGTSRVFFKLLMMSGYRKAFSVALPIATITSDGLVPVLIAPDPTANILLLL